MMNNLAREQLKYIIVQYGRSLSQDPQRCEALLRDLCGQYRKEINVIVSAAKEGVPVDLNNSQNRVPSDLLLAQLTKRLEDRLAIDRKAARWAVESWALALGLISEGSSTTPNVPLQETSTTPVKIAPVTHITSPVQPQRIPQQPQTPSAQARKLSSNAANRRNFILWLGFGGFWSVSALVLDQIYKNSSSDNPVSNSKSNAPTPKLTKIQFTSVKLNNSGKIIDKPSGSAKIFKEDLGNGIKLTMVKIPSGRFLMGSPESEVNLGRSRVNRSNITSKTPSEQLAELLSGTYDLYKISFAEELPQHQVTVPEFYLGQTLITQAQWMAIMGNNPSAFQGNHKLPVEQVTWLDAMDFCQKLSQKTGRAYRLPSEAEWEYACRAGTTTPFAFGKVITSAVANYTDRKDSKTTPVGSFPPNLFGLYDMHGNLREWCLDETVSRNYNGAPTDGSAIGDISSRKEGLRRVRGGSWSNFDWECGSAARASISSTKEAWNWLGLRVVFR